MATRRINPDPPDDDDVLETGAVDELSQVLGELESSGSGTVKVERLREGKRPEFVGELSPSGFSLGLLQDRFGGGEYALTVLDGARRYVKRATVSVAAPLKTLVPAVAESSAIDKLAEAMEKQSQMIGLLVMQGRQASAPAPAVDPQAMRRQFLEEMQLMKGILGGGGQSVGPDKVLELVMKGMEIAKETAGGKGGWEDVAFKALDTFGEPLSLLMQSTAANAPPVTNVPGAAPALAGTQPAPQPSKVNSMLQYLDFLVKKAAVGSDPTLYAELVLDNVPEHLVRQFLAEGDPVAKLARFDSRVSLHAQWFRDLGKACTEALNADDAGAGSSPTAADGDAGGNS